MGMLLLDRSQLDVRAEGETLALYEAGQRRYEELGAGTGKCARTETAGNADCMKHFTSSRSGPVA